MFLVLRVEAEGWEAFLRVRVPPLAFGLPVHPCLKRVCLRALAPPLSEECEPGEGRSSLIVISWSWFKLNSVCMPLMVCLSQQYYPS